VLGELVGLLFVRDVGERVPPPVRFLLGDLLWIKYPYRRRQDPDAAGAVHDVALV
jgi:hypothetical protein